MSTIVSRLRARSAKASVNGTGDHHRKVANTILLSLTAEQRERVLSKMSFVQLPTHTILNEISARIDYGYFVNSGLASVLNVMSDGKSVEVGLAGTEGFIGAPLLVGLKTSPTRVVMQVAGSAFRIKPKDLMAILHDYPKLEIALLRYTQTLAMQATQVAACNRLHEVDERLARWLLMSQDRLSGRIVPLTQEFLAHMLGTRRASVTVAAGILQKAGLITYTRGSVTIEDRELLEDAACECYGTLTRQAKHWQNESK